MASDETHNMEYKRLVDYELTTTSAEDNSLSKLEAGPELDDEDHLVPLPLKGVFSGFKKLMGIKSAHEIQMDKYMQMSPEELIAEYNKKTRLNDFELLKKFHRCALPLASYDSSSPIQSIKRFAGTTLEMVLDRADFWILLILHVVISISFTVIGGVAVGGLPSLEFWPKISVAYIAVPGGIVTFTLTFYVNQTYSRYLLCLGHVGGAIGTFQDVIMLMRVHMPDTLFPHAKVVRHQLTKFMNATVVLAFAAIPQNLGYKGANIDRWCFYFLHKTGLLTPDQIKVVKPLMIDPNSEHAKPPGSAKPPDGTNGSLAFKEVMMWTTRGIWTQVHKKHLDTKVASLFTYKLWEVRGHLDGLFGSPSGPIPFAYYHLLNSLVIVYLLFLSYAFIFVAPLWSIPGFIIIEFALLGLRELGNAMSNPFGCDAMDIPLFDRAKDFLKLSFFITNHAINYPDELECLHVDQDAGAIEGIPSSIMDY